ncbi:putative peptide maturation dehydrogenase [Coralloluteibacterium stylophorae]|uniref:Peptide maturation dehydrogenase n=1 Tax=Coralloluteibacterium stylophorae TaxID=1776034 RepID=A0A8J8AWY5_9GAMM|nr:putative peptide maturation dehydrogenase [Coralloluteibacterium stylophorae]MBS7457470.1 putative peptide maturation dehydrogenase [Coralloluteibacterium stylophorae]
MRVRRRQPCQIEIDDRLSPDIGALLRGTMRLDAEVQCHLLCPVTGERIALSRDELALIATLDAREWVDIDALAARGPLDATAIAALAARGGLLSDADTPAAEALRKGEDDLYAVGWHPQAAIFHAMTRWSGVTGEGGTGADDEARSRRMHEMVRRHGLPPPHFFVRDDALEQVRLPVQPPTSLGQVLARRSTSRHFDGEAHLPLDDLAAVLQGTFGVLGTNEFIPGVAGVRKTSPSGGSLHPIEAYVLAPRVAALEPGLYHYCTATHALGLLRPLDGSDARALALRMTSGQTYFQNAHALILHVARGERSFWKYRRHAKAYKVLCLDSGHLSQTLYLLAAERGLGAFYTAAINDGDIEAELGLDPIREQVIGANGLGIVSKGPKHLNLTTTPYCATSARDGQHLTPQHR